MTRLLTAFFALLGLTIAIPAAAQDAVHGQGPMEAVIAFSAAFDAQDEAAMAALLVEGATVGVVMEQDGPDRVRIMPMAGLVSNVAGSASDLSEPMWNLRAVEDGPVAMVAADYLFLVDGERSHCGTNLFTLMRVDGAWKIASVTYSHVTECPDRP